ncbi:unnamed protein product [Tilletia controversa]|uniref:Uncharacterized protein n=1 Tax=Tilletia controversa TaxID=13291 RepID=A0A8X7MIA1_9BASI|nr:hypothetical protein A4X06_0g9612 [Tilletia controversa]CAD6914548.1 unnamed protein product [Tilletia controversa]
MRVLRPWSDEAFMSSVPTSVEVLHDLHESRLITAPVGPPDCFMKKSLPPTSTGPSLPRRLSRPASSRSRVAPPPSSAVGPGSTTSCLLRRAVSTSARAAHLTDFYTEVRLLLDFHSTVLPRPRPQL